VHTHLPGHIKGHRAAMHKMVTTWVRSPAFVLTLDFNPDTEQSKMMH